MKKSSSNSNQGLVTDAIRAVIMALVVIIFIGYIFIWFMTPTNLYRKKWLPLMRIKANSTYFGNQGPVILVYTFPVLLVAIMSGVYLHLGTKNNNNLQSENEKTKSIIRLGAAWKRPMVMKGLGIVSRIEFAFFVMFIALLTWSLSTYLHNSFATITTKSLQKSGHKMWEAKLENAGLRLGLVGNIILSFLFYPVTRGSSILPIIGLTSESSVKYHIWLGHLTLIFYTAHGICYIVYWAATNQSSEMLKWAKHDISNLAGEIALLCGLAMWVTAIPRIRRKAFELFFYTHQLYALFVIFFVLHVGLAFPCIMLPGFFLFLVDRFLRFLQSRSSVRLVSARLLPCDVVQLDFSKTRGLNYNPTSIMFLNVPSISKMQWHPFTVASSSSLEPEKLSVIIKCDGNWSRKLFKTLSNKSMVDRLDVAIEGPYGPVSNRFLSHNALIMVSGGSGITPFISIIRELIFLSETLKTPEILLIAVFKNSSDLTMLELMLPCSGSPTFPSNFNLRIEAYVTRQKQPPPPGTLTKASVQTVYLKPAPSDAPISPVLGPNSWLWLSVIICSSFVMFLIFMGIMTRYYIYPIDHNTNHIYSYTSRALLNMVIICASISVTASAAFYWNKKQLARDTNQILNVEGATPMASPCFNVGAAERELESLPHESLLESTTVHYGERPDLKRILFERKERSIGVLASGPRQMRGEVARICSAGLEDNLHFESISFSW
ncbi:ferric reduction oxidase 2-like [Impatiens glandulifera]|uniref:ferric reduction oxidase 2-like n=1 Tax=Impatiens glandulifera TaxID=253017 RepID=UPI001FB102A5|nr:ferric reduction oxidase 2-like [Impatiens glandulifera]